MNKSKDLVYLYKRLLRSCETYPSKNRTKIYQSIRDDFRENANLDVNSEKCKKQIHIAYKGLGQLQQYSGYNSSSNFAVTLEQNPFPKPDGYIDKKTQRAEEQMLAMEEEEERKQK